MLNKEMISSAERSFNRPDSVEARHIMLSHENFSVDSAITTLNIIKNKVIEGADFGQLAQQYSEDQGSSIRGGDLGWFSEGQMVTEFNEACFSSEIGDLKLVHTQFGIHLIQITNNK